MINKQKYLITPSLLNSWAYIFSCVDNVYEAESDTCCLEDKKAKAQEKAKQDFLNTLLRIPSEPNEYMQRGIEFEDECYKGNTCVSPIIQGGAFQIVGTKDYNVAGMDFLLYGRLDVLKGGVVYDIKRVSKYTLGKYKKTYQQSCYLELFPSAYKMVYLAYDGVNLHQEQYYREECEPVQDTIYKFISYLKTNDLLKIYLEKWRSK